MLFRYITTTILIFFSFAALAAGENNGRIKSDACSKKVPRVLLELLARKFPDMRISLTTDQLPEDVAYDKKNGGDGCFSVASADFDGNKLEDIAVILTDNGKKKVKLIAALQQKNKWEIYELPTWCKNTIRCYVKPIKAGTYERSAALNYPITNPNEREKIYSENPGILSGTLEATGIVYSYAHGEWFYVWVSD